MTTPTALIEELERVVATGTEAQREEILFRITDLFLNGINCYSRGQVKLFDDLMMKLVAAIETTARTKLANRLASVIKAPSGVVRLLAYDDNIDVARPVLRASQQLDESDLVSNASVKSQQHLAAISERESLSEAVTEMLVARGNRDVVHSVATNPGARFSPAGYRFLVKRANGDDELTLAVGARHDLPRNQFLRLLEEASAAAHERLTSENPNATDTIHTAIDEVKDGIRNVADKLLLDYAAARQKIEALQRAGQLTEDTFCRFAQERRFEDTVVAISLLSGVELELVESAMLGTDHQFILILCKLANFSTATAKLILLFKMAGRNFPADDLDTALRGFERLQMGTARRALSFYRDRAEALPAAANG